MFEEKDIFEEIISNETFEKWINKDFVSDEIKDTLKKASILILPMIGFRDENEVTFANNTLEVYQYFSSKLPNSTNIEICIADENYQELALHSNYKQIGIFMVTFIVAPIFVGVLNEYIKEKYIKQDEAKPKIQIVDKTKPKSDEKKKAPRKNLEDSRIKFTIIVSDSVKGQSKTFNYEGPAKNVKETIKDIKELWNNENK